MSQAGTEQWTIQRLLSWTADYFRRHGRDVPRLAAEVLLAEALDCRRIDLYTRYEEVPAEPALGNFRAWVRRHAGGEPVAYLVGHKDFYSLRFKVTPDVLIPRPESELLVVEALDALKSINNSAPVIIDVGTGSGCIAISLAKHAPTARILALDSSLSALEVAKENARQNKLFDCIDFRHSDLLAATDLPNPDLIVSNPPYVGQVEIGGALAADVLRYEPAAALFGGQRGDELTRRLILESAKCLRPGGFLIFETSPMLAAELVKATLETDAFESCLIKKDLAKLDRAIVARLKS